MTRDQLFYRSKIALRNGLSKQNKQSKITMCEHVERRIQGNGYRVKVDMGRGRWEK